MATRRFEFAILKIVPPWLRGKVGSAIMRSIGKVFDTAAAKSTQSVLVHYPRADAESALGYIEADRGIIRGPYEPADVYVARVRTWLADHRTRGNAYTLLRMMHAYMLHWHNVTIDLISWRGTRHSISTSGVITQDEIAGGDWDGGGGYPDRWSGAVMVFHLAANLFPEPLLTEDLQPIFAEDGAPIMVDTITQDLSEATREALARVPRAWAPAHLADFRIALLYPGARLWGYRTPDGYAGTWDNNGTTGDIWDGGNPVVLQCAQ